MMLKWMGGDLALLQLVSRQKRGEQPAENQQRRRVAKKYRNDITDTGGENNGGNSINDRGLEEEEVHVHQNKPAIVEGGDLGWCLLRRNNWPSQPQQKSRPSSSTRTTNYQRAYFQITTLNFLLLFISTSQGE